MPESTPRTLLIERGDDAQQTIECDAESGLFAVMRVVKALDEKDVADDTLRARIRVAIKNNRLCVAKFKGPGMKVERQGATLQQLVVIVRAFKSISKARDNFLARYDNVDRPHQLRRLTLKDCSGKEYTIEVSAKSTKRFSVVTFTRRANI